MVAAEMVLAGDALQGSRIWACRGMERKAAGPPVGVPGNVRRARRVRGAGIREQPQKELYYSRDISLLNEHTEFKRLNGMQPFLQYFKKIVLKDM
jgi:hypothetical protein